MGSLRWTVRRTEEDVIHGITYSEEKQLFVAVGPDMVLTSRDAIAWQKYTVFTGHWSDVIYAHGLFVAVGSGRSSDGDVMTSPDGVNWTVRSVPSGASWSSISYGNGIFVAVSNSSQAHKIITSPDGINWTSRSSPLTFEPTPSVCFGAGLFVVVSPGYFSMYPPKVMTSPDGVNWTVRSVPNGGWRSVTYYNGVFVAVAFHDDLYHDPIYVMASNNGINWTVGNAPPGSWVSITAGNGIYTAVSGFPPYNIFSLDGINWALTYSPSGSWGAVTYGAGIFVAASYSTTVYTPTIMTGLIVDGGIYVKQNGTAHSVPYAVAKVNGELTQCKTFVKQNGQIYQI